MNYNYNNINNKLYRLHALLTIELTSNFITKINKPMIINQGCRAALALAFEELAQMSLKEIRIQNANI